MITAELNENEYNPYYRSYINKSADIGIVNGLKSNLENVVSFYNSIPENKHDFSYAEGKWTIKDILLHIIDTERIFTYRALRIARKDKTPLSGFDQDDYVITGDTTKRSLSHIIKEYKAVRIATIALYESFNDEALMAFGTASNSTISVRALGYIITGHENHHNDIIKERYL